jgi:hypothetical protein
LTSNHGIRSYISEGEVDVPKSEDSLSNHGLKITLLNNKVDIPKSEDKELH